MKLVIEIDCDNAAFDDGPETYCGTEVATILRKLATDFHDGDKAWFGIYYADHNLLDSNGNTVGKVTVKE